MSGSVADFNQPIFGFESDVRIGRSSSEAKNDLGKLTSPIESKRIEKEYIPVHGIKRSNIRDFIIEKRGRENATDDVIDTMISEIKTMKKKVIFFAKTHIHHLFIEALHEKQIFHLNTMEEILAWWTNNASNTQVQDAIAHMMYLYFDSHKRWEYSLEETYMRENHIEYLNGRGKGCIARIISNVKNEQIRRIRNLKDKSGVVLTVHKDKNSEGGKYKRRKKGEFYVKYDIDIEKSTTNPLHGECFSANILLT